MHINTTDLVQKATKILETNYRDGYTIPSERLYPFQWNWDSGFIALGYLHTQPELALIELETLFAAQWDNGFVPHIVFYHAERYGEAYFPSAGYWNSSVSDKSPKAVPTSGITQPPVHGYVLGHMLRFFGPTQRIKALYQKVMKYHQYLLQYRDAHQHGLAAIWHNWESGMDNSPWWDKALGRIGAQALEGIQLARKDNKAVSDSNAMRPSDDDYKRYIWLLNTLKDHQYESIPADYPFQMLDLAFNTLLLVSNEALIKLGDELGEDTSWLKAKHDVGLAQFNQLMWNEQDQLYYPYDLVSGQQVPLKGAACFLPLVAGVATQAQAEALVGHLTAYDGFSGVPSFDPSQEAFEPKKYWRGPVWINMNYMIWQGLKRYGFTDMANTLKKKTLGMVENWGFYEYFSHLPQEGQGGYGGHDFSWSASLVLDMIKAEEAE